MPRGPRQQPSKHAEEILSYFLRHREAADTVEGIARWRLLEDMVKRRIDETQAAIQWLVAQSLLIQESGVATQPMFRLNPRTSAQADRLVREAELRRRRVRSSETRA